RSPCFTRWLSVTGSSVIVPLTCGTTPMMSAATTASSVSGCRRTRPRTTIASAMAPTTIATPTTFPTTGRRSLILAPEQEEPGRENPEAAQARVHERRRTDVGRHLCRNEQLAARDRKADPEDDADQPCGEKRAQHVDGRCESAAGKWPNGGNHHWRH